MTSFFAVVSPFAMVVAIVAIIQMSKIRRTQLMMGQRGPQDDRTIATMQMQIDKLSERVQVLEKLVTDEDRKLAQDIERLRDRRPGAY